MGRGRGANLTGFSSDLWIVVGFPAISINRLTDFHCTDATVFVYKAFFVVVVAGVFFNHTESQHKPYWTSTDWIGENVLAA